MRAVLSATFLLLAAPVVSAGALANFGWFAGLVGSCWSGQFPDGKTRHSQCYTSQFDRFVRGTATLSGEHDGQMTDQFFGDSVFAWDEKDQKIVYYIWGSDGSHGRYEASYAGDELVFPVRSRKDPAVIAYRSVWRRIDADTFEVRRESPDAAGWKTELTVVYRRDGAAR